MYFMPTAERSAAMAPLPELLEPTADLLAQLENALGAGSVVDPEPRYLEEPRARFTGRSRAVLKPRTPEDVAAAVCLCASSRVGLVPYGGGTGLVGGQIHDAAPASLVLSLERLSAIREVDTLDNILTAEAGVILAEVHAAAERAGRLFPLALASVGSARIGGLLATNAGGINVLRYGNARDLCLGVEAVMADGSIVHGLSHLRKDNTGYDLRNLLIGSEGTLGIITAASLRLFPRPGTTVTAWFVISSPAAALDLLGRLRDALGETISAYELMHRQGLEFLREQMPEVSLPLGSDGEWSVLLEVETASALPLEGLVEEILASAMEEGIVGDALLSRSEAQRESFWRVREAIPEANRRIGSVSSHDISVPPSRLAEFVERGPALLAAIDPTLRVNCFGHLGDGNLHYNVFPALGRRRHEYEALRARIKETVHDLCHSLGGSVSAEHGIGRLKCADLERYGDPAKLAAMRAIKTALDPSGILNPGAVLKL
jgi:FAD/FMN-containing dehydrogenase